MSLRLYRRGCGWMLGRTFLMLVHVGRKTGESHDTVAMVLSDDADTDELVICSAWGPEADWIRNLQAGPAREVRVGHERFVPEHRFLSEDEAVAVAVAFRQRHPYRLRLLSTVLGWGDLRTDDAVRDFVRARPFVALRPTVPTEGIRMTATNPPHEHGPLLDAVLNLSRFHREHEKFYASAPRERAVTLQRHARTLHALADQWTTAVPSTDAPLSPFAGADDLNDPAALQLEGVLFMEGEGEPAELTHLIRDLRATAEDYAQRASGWPTPCRRRGTSPPPSSTSRDWRTSSATGIASSPTTGSPPT